MTTRRLLTALFFVACMVAVVVGRPKPCGRTRSGRACRANRRCRWRKRARKCVKNRNTNTASEPLIKRSDCPFFGDGVCDDGGAGSSYSLCAYGTDFPDCPGREPRVFPATTTASDFELDFIVSGDAKRDALNEPLILSEMKRALGRWESVIVGDVGDNAMSLGVGDVVCARYPESTTLSAPVTWDDVLVVFDVATDMPADALAQASPCMWDENDVVRAGIVRINAERMQMLFQRNQLYEVFSHEIAHVLGLGVTWKKHEFINKKRSHAWRYSGPSGPHGSHAIDGGWVMPFVQTTGGAGSRGSHWEESVYHDELMTPYLDADAESKLSALTVAALMDLGYRVDEQRAEPFSVGDQVGFARSSSVDSPSPKSGSLRGGSSLDLSHDVLDVQPTIVHSSPRRS